MIETTETTVFAPDDHVELGRNYMFRWEESQNAHILLYPEGVVKLNATAGEILDRFVRGLSVGQTIADLEARYDGADADIAHGVMKFLEVSHAKGWIRRKT